MKKEDHLQRLEDEFTKIKLTQGISNTKLARVLREKGICLVDCVAYGHALRKVLRNDSRLRISRNLAKKYKYVKQCLIQL
jgi:hypothetical protein